MSLTRGCVLLAFLFSCLGAFLAGASAQGLPFPYCACVRPTGPGTSPYVLAPPTTTKNADSSTTVCWALTTNAAATGPCAMFDLKKIEVDINTGCRGAVKSVLFGTDVISASYTSYPSYLTFKITRGNRDLARFADLSGKTTPVCITLGATQGCSTLPTFCRNGKCEYAFFSTNNKCCPIQTVTASSPPPPVSVSRPPPVAVSPFPYCACNKNPPFNSFSLSPSDVAPTPSVSNGRNTYCWDLSAARYTGDATSCVNFDLKKIEWDIKTGCQNAVSAITLNGQTVAASYGRYPALGGLTFKITHGTSDLASLDSLVAKPARVCITLNSICPTLASLCKTPFCRVAFFSSNNKCCPLQSLVNSAQ